VACGKFTSSARTATPFGLLIPPIGEVFSQARDLERVSGRVKIYAFTDTSFRLNVPPVPITLLIERGHVPDAQNCSADFEQVLAAIRADEGEVWLRKLGFGMNRAFSRERRVADVGRSDGHPGKCLSTTKPRAGVFTVSWPSTVSISPSFETPAPP
jgi:hypothetical protein